MTIGELIGAIHHQIAEADLQALQPYLQAPLDELPETVLLPDRLRLQLRLNWTDKNVRPANRYSNATLHITYTRTQRPESLSLKCDSANLELDTQLRKDRQANG